MNHVLDYRGYRFFQSSFHPDEKGTILSVNHDFLGTMVTYIGYFLLYFGLLAILFTKKSRFGQVIRKLKRLNVTTKWAGTIILFLISCQGYGQSDIDPMDSIFQKNWIPFYCTIKFRKHMLQSSAAWSSRMPTGG